MTTPTTKCDVCKRETYYPPELVNAQLATRNPKAKILCPEHGRARAIYLYITHRKRMFKEK